MDKRSGEPMLLAPPADGSSPMYLPSKGGDWPPVDEYLDPPEVTRYERVGSRRLEALPANAEHGDPHFHLDQLLAAHVAEGYVGSVDLKTRVSDDQEFASDTCIRKEGIDPETGHRYLEELVFEIVHKRSRDETDRRARGFAERGVRRQIGIFVKEGKVREWSTRSNGWRHLDSRRSLRDPCLVRPLPIRALFDAARAEVAVVLAMKAKGNPAIREIEAQGEARGEARGRAEALLRVLGARGFEISEAARERVLAATDRETLDAWLGKAGTAASLAEVLGED